MFVEHASGATMDRPQLTAVLDYLRPGDTLAVWRIDRLGRTLRGLVELIEDLREREVAFRSLTEAVDTASPMGEMVLTLIASFAQLERRVLVERTRAGLEAARARGAAIGRPIAVTPDKLAAVRALLADGSTVQAAATAVGVSRASVYRAFEREGLTAR